jgi:hypothetical protein
MSQSSHVQVTKSLLAVGTLLMNSHVAQAYVPARRHGIVGAV